MRICRKRTLAFWLSLVLLVSFLGCFAACAPQYREYTVQWFDYFDTLTVIKGYAKSEEEFDAVAGRIRGELAEYHRLYDIYHTYEGMNNLATVNSLSDGVHTVTAVDRRIIDLLLFSRILEQQTGGRMNVGMGAILSLWHDCRTAGLAVPTEAKIPTAEALSEAAEHCDLSAMILDENENTVFLADPRMTLDVGAIAKGYAVECIAQMLEQEGITGYLINVGGNVRTVGTKPNGDAWSVAVESPDGSGYAARLSLAGQSLVTSGSYQRFYTVDGVAYHHIVDPATRMPASYVSSVSVLADSSALADALSTALFCMSYEEGAALVASYSDVGVLWILPDGEQRMNDAFRAHFANT